MAKSKRLCGAETKSGGTCRNAVEAAGDRCQLHEGRPLSVKRILELMFKAVNGVAALGGAYQAFELAYPKILSIWGPLRGWLMPEYFWDFGFEPKDGKRMLREIEVAHRKSKELEIKYSHYSPAHKLAVEKAYRAILQTTESRRPSSISDADGAESREE